MVIRTQQEAAVAVNDILNALIPMGLAPAGTPFTLPGGGTLVAERHPELPSHWRPVWNPAHARMLPLDLGEFSAKVAAQQIARYRFKDYVALRLRLEELFALLLGDRVRPIESHTSPDSFLIGDFGLTIVERTSPHREPEYAMMLEPDALPRSSNRANPLRIRAQAT